MSEVAIQAERLGKRYRLGESTGGAFSYKSLRESLTAGLRRIASRESGAAPAEVWALRNVSFEIPRGEVVGIIGPNGAGKSTLLKLLSRITRPTEGRARIFGRVGSLLEVGTGFHPELTGRENVYLNGAILGMLRSEIDSRFDEIVAFAEVERFLDTPVKRYSSGMYMRLAFAVAAHLEPEILLVDEVLAVGDAAFQKKCLGKMDEVARGGRTVLFVSHNMNAVQDLCSRAMLLREGGIKRYDTDVRGVTRDYLFGDGEAPAGQRWINPGTLHDNPYFKPMRFEVVDQEGRPVAMPMRNDTEAWIEIEAEVRSVDPALTVGYAIYAEHGDLLYWSYQTDVEERQWPEIGTGRTTLRSRIPPRWLNEGRYRIELIGGLHFRSWLFEPSVSAPSIFLTIQGGLSDSPYWMQRRPGLLAPTLPWEKS
ncbi:MAG: ATP-binding cassette domain-containing protein [bacterium]|nr:ATP-binding cassette domain-containing protein [bacterium]